MGAIIVNTSPQIQMLVPVLGQNTGTGTQSCFPWTAAGSEFVMAAQQRGRIAMPSEIVVNELVDGPVSGAGRRDTFKYGGDRSLRVTLNEVVDDTMMGVVELCSMGLPDAALIVSGGRFFGLNFSPTTEVSTSACFKFGHEGSFLDVFVGINKRYPNKRYPSWKVFACRCNLEVGDWK